METELAPQYFGVIELEAIGMMVGIFTSNPCGGVQLPLTLAALLSFLTNFKYMEVHKHTNNLIGYIIKYKKNELEIDKLLLKIENEMILYSQSEVKKLSKGDVSSQLPLRVGKSEKINDAERIVRDFINYFKKPPTYKYVSEVLGISKTAAYSRLRNYRHKMKSK